MSELRNQHQKHGTELMCEYLFFGNGTVFSWLFPLIVAVVFGFLMTAEWHNEENMKLIQNIETVCSYTEEKTPVQDFFVKNMTCRYTKADYLLEKIESVQRVSSQDLVPLWEEINMETDDQILQQLYDCTGRRIRIQMQTKKFTDQKLHDLTETIMQYNYLRENIKAGKATETALNLLFFLTALFAGLRVLAVLQKKCKEKKGWNLC